MAFIVQNDAGTIADANSYVTVQEYIDYFADRGVDATVSDTDEIQAGLIQSTDYMDFGFDYQYEKTEDDQTTEWPRSNLGIPSDIKKACFEYAKIILIDGETLSPNPIYTDNGQNVKTEKTKVGPIEESITYKDDNILHTKRKYPKADSYLKKYLSNLGGSSAYIIRA